MNGWIFIHVGEYLNNANPCPSYIVNIGLHFPLDTVMVDSIDNNYGRGKDMSKELLVDRELLRELDDQIEYLVKSVFPKGIDKADRSNIEHKLLLEIHEACEKIKANTFTLNDLLKPEISLGAEIVLSKILRDSLFSIPVGNHIIYMNSPELTPMDHIEFTVESNWYEEYPEKVRLLKMRLVNAEKIKDTTAVELLLKSFAEANARNRKLRTKYRHELSNDNLREFFFTSDYPELDGRERVFEVQLEYFNHPFQLQIRKNSFSIKKFDGQVHKSLVSCLDWMEDMKMASDNRKVAVESLRNSTQNPYSPFAMIYEVDVQMIENNPFYEFIWHIDNCEYSITRLQSLKRYNFPWFTIPEMVTMDEKTAQAIDKNIELIRLFASDDNSFGKTSIVTRTPDVFEEPTNEVAQYCFGDEMFYFNYLNTSKTGNEVDVHLQQKVNFSSFYSLVSMVRIHIELARKELEN